MTGPRIAFVPPWFGEAIPGGAETEVRTTALHLHQAGMDTPFLVVINAKTRGDNSLVEQTRELLFSWKTPIADTVISHRMQYINAITTGKTGPEKDKLAAAEIDKLWAEIKVAVRKAAKAKARAA